MEDGALVRGEEAVKTSDQEYEALCEVMQAGICLHEMVYDASGKAVDYRIIETNKAFAELAGIPGHKSRGALASELYGAPGLAYLDSFVQVVATGQPMLLEIYCASLDKHFRVSVFSPAPGRFTTVVADVSCCKKAEQALTLEKERLEVTLHAISDAVITADTEGRVMLLNPAAEVLTGWRQEEAVGRQLEEVFCIHNGRNRQQDGSIIRRVMQAEGVRQQNRRILACRDGTERKIEDSISVVRDRQGNTTGVVLVFRDITAKTALEAELRRAQKMEAVGTLAAGLAHEFNNILGIVLGNAELAKDDIPEWNPARTNLVQIKQATLRAKEVVRQLLTFSHRIAGSLRPLDLLPVVKEAITALQASLPASIELRQNLAEDCRAVLADPAQIHQMLINLAANAAHAMESTGGILELTLQQVQLQAEDCPAGSRLEPGENILIEVRDTGCGISPEILERIFDPYFTTKEIGQGTGMGLAVVHGIVETHGGVMRVESQLGRGSTFKVLLPVMRNEIRSAAETQTGLPVGSERILLVDDEAAMARLVSLQLKRLGYRVQQTTDPLQALELFRADPGRFDLLITDMVMPTLTGEELVRALLSIRGDLPVIVCTGFSEDMDDEKARKLGARAYALKPLEGRELAQMVRRVLDRKAR